MDSFHAAHTTRASTYLIALGIITTFGLAAHSAWACKGQPPGPWVDASFGENGIALVQFETEGDLADIGNAVAVQPDGRILVAGTATLPDRRDGAVLRLMPDGTIDTTFGNQGRRLLGIATEDGLAPATDIRLQSDGRIVLFGRDRDRGLYFARLHADGSFDESFDLNGVRIVLLGDAQHTSARMTIDSDGRLIGVGSMASKDTAQCALIVRLEPDGANDASFGTNGRVCLHPDPGSPGASISDVAILPDGRILVAGSAISGDAVPSDNVDMFALRLTSGGTPDPDFGNAGWRLVAFDQGGDFRDFALALNVDTSGRITLAGMAEVLQSRDMAIARLTASGQLDAGFGSSGRVLIPFDHDGEHHGVSGASRVIELDDERLMLAGVATRQHSKLSFPPAGAAAMLNSDGTLDTCFEDSGRWVLELPERHEGVFRDMARHDDRIYLIGFADVLQDSDPSRTRSDLLVTAFTFSEGIFADRFEQ